MTHQECDVQVCMHLSRPSASRMSSQLQVRKPLKTHMKSIVCPLFCATWRLYSKQYGRRMRNSIRQGSMSLDICQLWLPDTLLQLASRGSPTVGMDARSPPTRESDAGGPSPRYSLAGLGRIRTPRKRPRYRSAFSRTKLTNACEWQGSQGPFQGCRPAEWPQPTPAG
jgi:hypothetical protein